MSTARFAISHAPPRGRASGFYISAKAALAATGTAPPTPTPAPSCSTASAGRGSFSSRGQLYPVQPDDLVIVNPQVEHTELSLNAAPLEYVVLGISGIEVLFGSSDEPYAILNCREQRERLGALLHMLLAEADHSLDGYETVCQDLLEVLLIWLVRSSTLSVQLQRTTVRAENRECAEIKRYIDTNYRESITLDKLAGMAT